MLVLETAHHFIEDRYTRKQLLVVLGPSISLRRRLMEQMQWSLHMDGDWMWRWFLTNDCGRPLAMSKSCFFHRGDAVRNRDTARMAVIGL